MAQRITVVDAFTHRAVAGNPAAVCVLPHPTTDAWMLQVARELAGDRVKLTGTAVTTLRGSLTESPPERRPG